MKVDADRIIRLAEEKALLKQQIRDLKEELKGAQARWRSQNHKLQRFSSGLNSRIHDLEKTFAADELRDMPEYRMLKELAAELKSA